MAPRKWRQERRGVGRKLIGSVTAPPNSINTHGFANLADEIYLEIVSYIPSVPIPTTNPLESYPEIRRSRHETLLSLSQTSRSLRRVFWRYLWQRIEVREGMRIGDEVKTLRSTPCLGNFWDATGPKKYAKELVRQLEIVTVRNPQLAQYVNYVDIFIGEHSLETVLAELAHCLTLFSNLHTVQIDVVSYRRRSLAKIVEKTFKSFSYPQIRNVFVMNLSEPLIASCPQTRRVSIKRHWWMFQSESSLQSIIDNCPHLEVLDFPDLFSSANGCKLVVDNFPNLRTIQVSIALEYSPRFDVLKNLNNLQTIIIDWHQYFFWNLSEDGRTERAKEDWIESLKHILIQIQLRDNLEKTIVVKEYQDEKRILLKPKAFIGFEEGSF